VQKRSGYPMESQYEQLVKAIKNSELDPGLFIDILLDLHRVKTHGWGTVVIMVKDKKITQVRGETTRIYALEQIGK